MKQSENYKPLTLESARNLAAPQTWAASVLPVLFGVFYCRLRELGLTWKEGAILLAACVLLQSAVNTLNDYFDFVKGVDSAADHVEVSDAVLIYEGINPRSAMRLGVCYMALGAALGLYVCLGNGMVPVCIGFLGILAVFLYSGGPLPISGLPLGEVVSGVVMGGLIPLGIGGCADGRLHGDILIYSLPLVLGIGLIMMTNNGSDIEKDRKAGRMTLPVRLGRKRTRRLYRACMMIWLFLVCVLPVTLSGTVWLFSPILLLLVGIRVIKNQFSCSLRPEDRIAAMGGIALTNLLLNGVYTMTFMAGVVREVYHG